MGVHHTKYSGTASGGISFHVSDKCTSWGLRGWVFEPKSEG